MRSPSRESSRARFYHNVQLRGPIPQRLIFHPEFSTKPSPALVEAALIWGQAEDPSPVTQAGTEAFHRFDWLPILAVAGNEGRDSIRKLICFWLEHHGRFAPPAWRASICATRLIRMLCHIDVLTHDMDGPLRLQLHDCIARQARHLARFQRKGRPRQRLSLEIARTIASLCLPEDRAIGPADSTRLGALLRPLASGELPDHWRDMNSALQEADHLILLSDAFLHRRLSAPPELDEAIKVVRLYIGGFLTPDGGIVQLPGRHAPDMTSLSRLDPIIRPEAEVLLSRMGYRAQRSENALLMIDMGYKDDITGVGAMALTIEKTPLIINCGCPSQTAIGLADRMTAWANALSSPAACSGFDIPALAPATETAAASGLSYQYPTRRGEITRQFTFTAAQPSLVVEDSLPSKNLHQRLHIGLGTAISNDGERITLPLETDRYAELSLEGVAIEIDESVSAWQDGDIGKVYQIVMSPCAPALRWRINWM